MNITLAQAEQLVAAAKEKSLAIDTKMNIAVVDALSLIHISEPTRPY